MRVLLVAINYDPEPTGIAPYVSGLARGLAAAGHEPHVLTGVPHYPRWRNYTGFTGVRRTENIDGIPVTRVRHFIPRGGIGLGRVVLEATFGLGALTAPWGDPDVVLTVSPPLIASAAVLTRARLTRRGPATALWSQDLYTRGLAELDSGSSWKATVGKAVEGAVYRAADGVIAIGDRFRHFATSELRVPADRVLVHHNWSHMSAGGSDDSASFRARMGWGDRPVVLHAGSMGNKQGLETVVEAARMAERDASSLLFVLMGDGSERLRLQGLAGDCTNIQFVDPLPGDEFRAALVAADVLLVNEKPGVSEMAIPSKLTTYFTAAKPVLAAVFPLGNTAALVDAAGAGRIVAPGDPRILLDEAVDLASDRELASRYGASAQVYAAAHMGSTEAVQGIVESLVDLGVKAGRVAASTPTPGSIQVPGQATASTEERPEGLAAPQQ